jgi:hypothetical protein
MSACSRNDRDLPSWSCEFDSRHPLHSKSLVGLVFLRPLAQRWPVDSEPWALYGPHLLEFTFDPQLQRIRDLAIPLARRVLVDQCSTHAAVARQSKILEQAAFLVINARNEADATLKRSGFDPVPDMGWFGSPCGVCGCNRYTGDSGPCPTRFTDFLGPDFG